MKSNKKTNNLEEAFKYLSLAAVSLILAALIGLWAMLVRVLIQYWQAGNPL